MTVATAPRTTATGLARLLGVTKKRIAHWHRKGVISGRRSPADRRCVLFELPEVRAAIDAYCLPVDGRAMRRIDAVLTQMRPTKLIDNRLRRQL